MTQLRLIINENNSSREGLFIYTGITDIDHAWQVINRHIENAPVGSDIEAKLMHNGKRLTLMHYRNR